MSGELSVFILSDKDPLVPNLLNEYEGFYSSAPYLVHQSVSELSSVCVVTFF